MKKLILLGALLLVFSTALSACKNYPTNADTDTPEQTTVLSDTTTTEKETLPMIEVKPDAIVDARLIMDRYREALTTVLADAGKDLSITSNGSDIGFDAVVLNSMEPTAYSVTVRDDAILVRAGHYLALEAAFQEILGGRGLEDGVSFTDSLTNQLGSPARFQPTPSSPSNTASTGSVSTRLTARVSYTTISTTDAGEHAYGGLRDL